LAQYDANILQKFADNLYAKARGIVVQTGLLGVLIGGLLGTPVAIYTGTHNAQAIVDRHKGHWEERQFIPDAPDAAPSPFDNIGLIAVGLFAVIGCLIGVSIGQRKAFQYKLQAQLTLCQMQTELNTRTNSLTTAA
jgi:hypothetical protein